MSMRSGARTLALLLLPVLLLAALPARAADTRDIESITVLADKRLTIALSELASLFAHESMVSVAVTFDAADREQKKIEDGEPADVFITSDKDRIEALKNKGLVDVYSIRQIVSQGEAHFSVAVIASENMTPARAFAKYLRTDEAKAVFRKNDLSVP